ncbi:MAG: hypothetical protein HYY84_12185 [Deltaproteobacteria bacterium]|nr:hypothetical protein [Deltaproteobacteria bacterium]
MLRTLKLAMIGSLVFAGVAYAQSDGAVGTSCPILLEASARKNNPREPRSREFMEKIRPTLTGTTARERVIQIAAAAARCGVHFGACIKAAETIYEVAGLGPLRTFDARGMTTAQGNWLIGLNCRAKMFDPKKKGFRACGSAQPVSIPNCPPKQQCAAAARAMLAEKLRREIPGWPDSLADQLEAGDSLWVYYANRAIGGQHTAIFMRWDGDYAVVVQSPNYGELVNEGRICVRSGCRGNGYPLTRVLKIR